MKDDNSTTFPGKLVGTELRAEKARLEALIASDQATVGDVERLEKILGHIAVIDAAAKAVKGASTQ